MRAAVAVDALVTVVLRSRTERRRFVPTVAGRSRRCVDAVRRRVAMRPPRATASGTVGAVGSDRLAEIAPARYVTVHAAAYQQPSPGVRSRPQRLSPVRRRDAGERQPLRSDADCPSTDGRHIAEASGAATTNRAHGHPERYQSSTADDGTAATRSICRHTGRDAAADMPSQRLVQSQTMTTAVLSHQGLVGHVTRRRSHHRRERRSGRTVQRASPISPPHTPRRHPSTTGTG